jgi:hypothetical protein
MTQLVGQRCLRCREVIHSILEGNFCPRCARPVHHKCKTPDNQPNSRQHCAVCGGDPSQTFTPAVAAAGADPAGGEPVAVAQGQPAPATPAPARGDLRGGGTRLVVGAALIALPAGILWWAEGRSGWGGLDIPLGIIMALGLGVILEGLRRLTLRHLTLRHLGQPKRLSSRGRVAVLLLSLIALAAGGNLLRLWYTSPSVKAGRLPLVMGIVVIVVGILSLWFGVRRGQNPYTGFGRDPAEVADAINTFR